METHTYPIPHPLAAQHLDTQLCIIVSIIHSLLLYSLVSNWHVDSKLLTDYSDFFQLMLLKAKSLNQGQSHIGGCVNVVQMGHALDVNGPIINYVMKCLPKFDSFNPLQN